MKYRGYEDTDLIPELTEWKKLNGDDFSVEDWLNYHTKPNLTIAYSTVFCPEFEEYNNGLFFKGEYNRYTMADDIEKHHNGDYLDYQSFVNCRDITYFMYSSHEDSLHESQVEFMGKLLERIWGYQLKAEFPHYTTTVKYCGLDVNTIDSANVTFWAKPKETN